MARIRSIKPEFWTDRSLARRLSRDARMFYVGLWNFADEHGRVSADPHYLKGQIFPYEPEGAEWIDSLIEELVAAGKAVRYEVDDDPYLFLSRLERHQRLEPEKVPSRLPAPPPETEDPQVSASAQIRADESAQDSDELPLLYVAGSRLQVAGSRDSAPKGASEPEPTFDDFWEIWPRKTAKADAKRAWKRAVAKPRASPAAIIAACHSYAERCQRAGQETKFIPYPATWLNRESWDDDLDAVLPLQATGTSGHQPYANPTDPNAYSGDL